MSFDWKQHAQAALTDLQAALSAESDGLMIQDALRHLTDSRENLTSAIESLEEVLG